MYKEEEMVLVGGIVTVLGFIALMVYVVNCSDKAREERIYRCEKAGGVLLDRTYQAGKTTGHNYTCVDPSIIKDMN